MKKILIAAPVIAAGLAGLAHDADASEWKAKPVSEYKVKEGQTSYRVEWGDTLYNLAEYIGSDVDTLRSINHSVVSNPDLIIAGETLRLPEVRVTQVERAQVDEPRESKRSSSRYQERSGKKYTEKHYTEKRVQPKGSVKMSSDAKEYKALYDALKAKGLSNGEIAEIIANDDAPQMRSSADYKVKASHSYHSK